MKLSKWEGVLLFTVALYAAFLAGWMAHGRVTAPLRVETQRELAETYTALPAPSQKKVNVNTAGLEELMTLPGIGEKRAAAIIEDREKNGPFRYPEDIARVEGIGQGIAMECMEYVITEEEP